VVIIRHHMAMFGNPDSNLIKLYQYHAKLGGYLIIIYIQLMFRCLNDDTWQVITISANTAVKTDIHIQLAPVARTKCKKLVVSSQFSHDIL
jgi:hypothetical protein